MAGNLIAALVNRVRKVLFTEKAPVHAEDLDLEHLSLYHGLVGSSPENQRNYQDVRADIYGALRSRSALQLGMALKLPPLLWEDKLRRIFSEVLTNDRDSAIVTLLPDTDGSEWPNISDPLGHSDWRVRANAAMILSFLQAQEGLQRMISSLHDTAHGGSPAFPHIANALSKLGGEPAKQALIAHLQAEKNWLAVDAVAALANWPLAEVGNELMAAVLSMNPLTDYMSVSIARKVEPLTLLASDHDLIREGGCQVVIGLLEASQQTFSSDLLRETNITACFPQILKLVQENPNPVSLAAGAECSRIWTETLAELQDHQSKPAAEKAANELRQIFSNEQNKDLLRKIISASVERLPTGTVELNRLRFAIRLAGQLKLNETEQLLKLLPSNVAFTEEIVQAIGVIGDEAAAQPLIDLANSIFTVSERAALPKSQQPIAEDNATQAKLYWRILQALGNIQTEAVIDFLLLACRDFAPDKRQQALESLHSLHSLHKSLSPSQQSNYAAVIDQALADPSAQMRVTALKTLSALDADPYLDKVLRLTGSQEVSVSRQAFKTLEQFHQKGNKKIGAALRARISSETDQFKRKRLSDFLENLGG